MGRVTNMNMSIVWCPANPWLQYNLQWIVITHQPGVSRLTSPPQLLVTIVSIMVMENRGGVPC